MHIENNIALETTTPDKIKDSKKAKNKKPESDKKLHLKIENSSNVIVKPISSPDLREALQNLGKNVLFKKVF